MNRQSIIALLGGIGLLLLFAAHGAAFMSIDKDVLHTEAIAYQRLPRTIMIDSVIQSDLRVVADLRDAAITSRSPI